MRAPYRGRFDPDRDFVVRRRLTVDGETLYPGDPFDKTLVTTRRLRQLFDHRTLIYPGDTPGAILSPEETAEELSPAAKGGDKGRKRRSRGKRAPKDDKPERTAITIPEGWETLPWPTRLKLAASLTDGKVHNGEEAAGSITAELERRAKLP